MQYAGYSRSLACMITGPGPCCYWEMHHSSILSRKSEKMAFSVRHQKRAAGQWGEMNCWGRSVVTASETIKGMDSVVIWIASRACIWYRKRGLGMCDSEKSPRSPPSDSQTMSRDMRQLPFAVAGGSCCMFIVRRATEKLVRHTKMQIDFIRIHRHI